MSLEQKIKALLEGAEDKAITAEELAVVEDESITEGEAGADNAKIVAGKSKKLEDDKVKGAPSTDETNNKKNAVDKQALPVVGKGPNVSEHVDALLSGEDLSEDFKVKASAIMEAAITEGVAKEITRLEEQYAVQLDEAVEAVRDELVEEIDGYLTEMVEKWMVENELALERGVKNDIMENFVNGLKDLFKENYIEVPEEKYNVLDEQAEKIDELTTKLDESTEQVVALAEEVKTLTKLRIMESVGDSLTDTEFEKFAGLIEGIDFTSAEKFEEKAKAIKESYFPKTKRATVISESDTPVANNLVEGAMSHYVNALASPLAFKR